MRLLLVVVAFTLMYCDKKGSESSRGNSAADETAAPGQTPSTTELPTPKATPVVYKIDFEDPFGKVEGQGSKLDMRLPQTIGEVKFSREDATSLLSFAGGYSGENSESFATDYLGLWTYHAGMSLTFPKKTSKVAFTIHGCACFEQGKFELSADSAVVTTFGPSSPSDEPVVTVSFPTPVTSFTIRNISGSSSLLPFDNLEWTAAE